MASFAFDQAEGLRRMLAGPKPRVCTVLSAAAPEEKSAMLVNLGASLVQAGRSVLLFDARPGDAGVAAHLDGAGGATLAQVARQERALEEVVRAQPQGFGVARLARGPRRHEDIDAGHVRRLGKVFGMLAARADMVVVDAETDADGGLPLPGLADGEIVVQVTAQPSSITAAYAIIKRLHARHGRRPYGVIVTGASDEEARTVFRNMAQAASRYLAVTLESLGSVPADEHVRRAARLGRSVIDAYPLAGASVAFRRLAGRFDMPGVPPAPLRGIPADRANFSF